MKIMSHLKKRILIVEDENIVALDIKRCLTKRGFEIVKITNNSEDAIKTAMKERPDLILMDIDLKGKINGIQTAKIINKDIELPIVFLTAYSDESSIERAKDINPHGYILKPFNDIELCTAIEVAFSRHNTTREILRRSEEKFQFLVDAVKDYSICLLDSNGNITHWNSGAERICEYTDSEVIGKFYSFLYTSEDRLGGLPERDLDLAKRTGKYETEELRVRKNGTQFWSHTIIRPIYNKTGALTGYSRVTRDITEQRKAQEELKKNEEQLRQLQKMEVVGRISAGIAHDFNNILCVIGLYVHKLMDTASDTKQIDAITKIDCAQKHGAALVAQLLTFSRKKVSNPTIVDINTVVQNLFPMLKVLAGDQISVVTNLSFSPAIVYADQNQVEQIIFNLAINARDSIFQNGTIEIKTKTTDQMVILSISDTGCGMTEEVKSHLFEPFFSTKGAGRGTGLGLATVHEIVKHTGGNISVSSEVGKGSEFKISIPKSSLEVQVEKASKISTASQKTTGTILLTEDQKEVREIITDLLRTSGFKVFAASDGQEALQVMNDSGVVPDLFVTDLSMPRVNGWQLFESQKHNNPKAPFLFLSGFADEDVVKKINLQPNAHFLPKPFNPQTLLNKIDDILGR